MFLSLRTSIIVFLVMVQLIAPLVHAHTGEKFFDRGLHLPGLEAYGRTGVSDAAVTLQTSSYHADSEGILVDIKTGLKDNQGNTPDDTDSLVYITPAAVVIKTTLSQFDTNFSPHMQQPVARLFVSAHPTRAPPQ